MLDVRNLSKDYPTRSGPLSVLRSVSFSLNRGESLAVSFHETEPSNIARYGIKETMVWNMQHPDTVRTTARFVVYEQRTFRQQGTAA